MPRHRQRKQTTAVVHFTSARNEKGTKQLCVFATCEFSGCKAGPVWGHGDESVRRVLATLSHECECRSSYHAVGGATGTRITGTRRASMA